MQTKIGVGFVAVILTVMFPATLLAQESPPELMEVIVIDPSAASETYQALFDKFTEFYKKNGSPAQRTLWNNAYAGSETGVVIVQIRWPNMAAFAAGDEMFQNPAYQALSQEFQQKGFRITSNSLMFRAR